MLFNSFDFIVFLTIVLIVYALLQHRNQNRLLLVASYVFYGWWDWRFLSLIAVSTVVDFYCAGAIAASADQSRKKRLLLVSVCSNLGILAFFKYFDFFAVSAASLLETVGLSASMPMLQIVLPVGISFYTFQTLGYTIDVYRGGSPVSRFDSFALYVAYFPQLVAGPIERSRSLLPQIERPRHVVIGDWVVGTQLIVVGFFKKLVIADGVAPYVDRAFANPGQLNGPEALLTLYLFALQIYGDFSGYTDIARGVSRLFGIRLSLNFRQPYLSASISEFWRRWHISLSSWLRDYLYIPLGGNRSGSLWTVRNLMITMLLGGLWHGASWNFVIWGGMHGICLALHRSWERRRGRDQPAQTRGVDLARMFRVFFTFHLICLLWVFFRAQDLATSIAVLGALAGPWTFPPVVPTVVGLLFLVTSFWLDLAAKDNAESLPTRDSWNRWQTALLFAALIAGISFVGESNVRPFIYFQF